MSFVNIETPAVDATPRMDAAWLDAYWMPCTANRQFKAAPRMIVAASGTYYSDAEGRKIFDGLSSHNEIEDAQPDHLKAGEAGCNVLPKTMLRSAGVAA